MTTAQIAETRTEDEFLSALADRIDEIQIDQLLVWIEKEHDLEMAKWDRVHYVKRKGKMVQVTGHWRRPGPRGGTLFRSTNVAHRTLIASLIQFPRWNSILLWPTKKSE